MDQARLSALTCHGLRQAAARIGASFAVYRPVGTGSPLDSPAIASVDLAYTQDCSLAFRVALAPDKPIVQLLCDPSSLQAGDYLVGTETLFVLRVDPARPASGVLCNATLSVLQSATATQPGTNAYGGLASSAATALATGWPASLLLRSKTEADPTRLPSDTRSAYYAVLLPAISGVTITSGMRLLDAGGNIYQIVGTQRSAFGWSISAALQTS
ncbi:hypothetical protein FHR90_002847 [Endobacter medicaginis]|uniref:Uncharacterized protein n=1 Tax=Endobacter medicaginis TaxID=1181271 RepID=A0A839V393_9PROT|nr:hypothetical protein [Endobacter medicaginis]MBB3175000.1 hypothetical protein [Endobacter medicaginis]MCX5475922.1 hypothetical protein [Endobacter medicaginis]NVN28850.1 hypothetical protein [Endobacter medicaginis]